MPASLKSLQHQINNMTPGILVIEREPKHFAHSHLWRTLGRSATT